jgi:DNA-binding NtrC family response regulator
MPDALVEVTLDILLIDDQEPIHQALKAVFTFPPPLTYRLHSAFSIEEGIKMATFMQPHVILLDLHFPIESPDMEGALAAIPGLSQHGAVIPFTGYETQKLWGRAISLGAVDFLSKEILRDPNDRKLLIHAITNATFLHDARQQSCQRP